MNVEEMKTVNRALKGAIESLKENPSRRNTAMLKKLIVVHSELEGEIAKQNALSAMPGKIIEA